ncbi:FISUMP domain-containing protein [Fibrobacter sp. UWCM]|uniref:FISUMP domain-containing protein n=1 Tax=Fibrobacter sp. UWCM TaxID=1896208 RepID=UPI0015870290|nr:FISUMP domain-containing protein [Fibrobacter sp. UWCM]
MRLVFALALTLALAACDDDESSFVRPGEDSSSSVCEDCDDASSSSVKSNSSSSAKSSSSVNAKSSSSSVAPKSSSSVRSSSSVASSSSVRSSSSAPVEDLSSSSSVKSSSSAKSSSSSVSSSSEYVPFDHSKTLGWQKLDGGYKTFTDSRNGRSYYYITIMGRDTADNVASVTVMAENLNVGADVSGDQDQNDDTKIERYCYNNDTTKCDEFGGLYQWAEMMQLPSECNTKSCADQIKPNHQGICPDGWRLLTYNDFYIILHSDGNTHGIEGLRSTFGFGGYNTTGYSLVGAGDRYSRSEGGFNLLNDACFWYYPIEVEKNNASYPGAASTSSTATTIDANTFNYTKLDGFSVRCVMVE